MAQITIIGCGWLGLPLAIQLQKSGHNIVTTCRSEAKAKKLQAMAINCQPWQLGEDLSQQRLTHLFDSSILILNIPVGRKNPKAEAFVENMRSLLQYAAQGQIQQVVFISTTSVYGAIEGVVTEQSPTFPDTESGKTNLAIERLVKQHFGKNTTIIRPAGLVGEDRHPIHFLAGKQNLTNAHHAVNLIHQKDVIDGIERVINNNIWDQTLHLSAIEHPSRQDYYCSSAKQLGLPIPEFTPQEKKALGKIIDPSHSLKLLDLRLSYPSPFNMLP